MKDENLINVLFDFLAEKKVSASKLAKKYEISKRTVFRYIDALCVAGVPIYSKRGNDGGFYIYDTFKIPSTFLTEKEYDAVISSLKAVNGEIENAYLSSGINKLTAANKGEKSSLTVTDGNLIIDAGPWGDTGGYRAKLGVIEKSIEQRKTLLIKYHDRTGEVTERVIEPHAIVFKQGLWYAYAFCRLRNEFRLFKTGRIEHANILDETFERKPLPDKPFEKWYVNENTQEVYMEIDKSVLSDVEEWIGIENVKNENGKFYARVRLPFDDGLISKILTFGAGIKVLEPEILKEKIITAAQKVTAVYNE